MIFAEKFKGNYRPIILSRLGIHGGAARKEKVWDHADLMHNILNSLRGEAVPEQGAMHGSAIQVSRQITSHSLCPTTCVRFNDSCFVNIGQKLSRRCRLGAVEGSTRSISDYRHGTASHQNILEGTKETPIATAGWGLELPTFSACHLFLAGGADNFSAAAEARLME
jgi:hypothetical protein